MVFPAAPISGNQMMVARRSHIWVSRMARKITAKACRNAADLAVAMIQPMSLPAVTFMSPVFGLGNVNVSTSMDGGTGGTDPGQAWQVNPAAATVISDDRMWVAAYGPQTLNMSYRQAPGTGDLFFVKSTDAGKTFGAPVLMRSGDSVEGNLVV